MTSSSGTKTIFAEDDAQELVRNLMQRWEEVESLNPLNPENKSGDRFIGKHSHIPAHLCPSCSGTGVVTVRETASATTRKVCLDCEISSQRYRAAKARILLDLMMYKKDKTPEAFALIMSALNASQPSAELSAIADLVNRLA